MSWVLIVYLLNRAPIALAATSHGHCLALVEQVKTIEGFKGGSCLRVHTKGEANAESERD